ncbi:MAG TPA: twin-arginine translocation signal domain-containing protein, partial [Chromatiaceae bacterium]|nr:twin-arginine translocation signal domain-containing protein [Chromatiaceae bacterium]
MKKDQSLVDLLREQGVSRRGFLKFCSVTASLMALPPSMVPAITKALEQARRPSVIWLSFQECTGCTESLTRSHAPTVESLILDAISLDYHHTLQAASGHGAEEAREIAMKENWGNYLVVVDGSIPLGNPGFSTIAGIANEKMLGEVVEGAAAVIAVGTCAAYGGLPHAEPNPTGAVSVSDIVKDKPVLNVPGCPPIPVVITGVLTHFLTFGRLPETDHLGRPLAFYGNSIHDRCYRRPFYERGQFAETFDDQGAKKGWCL